MTKDSAGERLTREKHAATAVARAGERLELEQQTTTRITRKQCSALVRVWELNRTGLSCDERVSVNEAFVVELDVVREQEQDKEQEST